LGWEFGVLSMFAMVFGKKGEFLPLFAKGVWGFLRCLPRFCGFRDTGLGRGGRRRGFPQIAQMGTNGWVMARTPSIEGDRAQFVRTRGCEFVGKGLGIIGLGGLFCAYFKPFCCQVVRAGSAAADCGLEAAQGNRMFKPRAGGAGNRGPSRPAGVWI
jgi:hypothetical protein